MRVELGAVPWSRAGDTALKGSIVSRVLLLILHGRGDLLITAHHLHQYTAAACRWRRYSRRGGGSSCLKDNLHVGSVEVVA